MSTLSIHLVLKPSSSIYKLPSKDLGLSEPAADMTLLRYVWIICFFGLLSHAKFDYKF